MSALSADLKAIVEAGPLAHVTTVNADGSPQVTVVWVGLDGDELVTAHLMESVKVRNARRDPRVVMSFLGPEVPGEFMRRHAVLHTRATITEGGAWDLLDRLATVYMAPDATFPAPQQPGGFVIRYAVQRVGGVGPWV
ncbi:MAG: PPOX class F420-dependent oxidoreductase [Phycicoccus sp.]